MVKDIHAGAAGSSPRSLVEFDGQVFFVAEDGLNGYELWRSDGTEMGTVLVKDFFPDGTASERVAPRELIVVGDTLFLSAEDGQNGDQIWTSDGTMNGTELLKVINPNNSGSLPDWFARFGDEVLFVADDGRGASHRMETNSTSSLAPGASATITKVVNLQQAGVGARI